MPATAVIDITTARTSGDADSGEPRKPLSLSLRDVCFAYAGGNPVLTGVSLDIPAGRRVAIVGASGSGKSSLIRLVLRLEEPQAGSIMLGGLDIAALTAKEVSGLVAVVLQDTMLFNETMAFNIGIGNTNATRCEIERAARLAQVHGFICSLPTGYETIVGERGLKLSGGERQRIAIARAILKDPRIYVFDEATSMLDSVTETHILQNLSAISEGVTTVTVAHRLSTIQHADEIFVLGGGRIVEQGNHTTLMTKDGEYAALWRAQQRVQTS